MRSNERGKAMGLDYKNYSLTGFAVSSDFDSVGVLMNEGKIENVYAPNEIDLLGAAEWLATYQVGSDLEQAQSLANVIAFLDLTVQSRRNRKTLAEAKRQYAATHGVKVSQVKIKKEAK
jgi:hypothetical protein